MIYPSSVNMFFSVLRKPCRFSTIGIRNYLSEAQKGSELWDLRLKTPIIDKIKIDEFYFEIDRKFNRESRISHVDLDIYANKITDPSKIDSLEDLVHRFRRTPACFKTLPSTHHAIIRAYLLVGETDALLKVLDDRFNFGLFLDPYSSVLLLDSFLCQENHRDASKVGIQLMLQEEICPKFALSRSMAAYGALKYALGDIKNMNEVPWDPIPNPEEDEPEEEVKIRVEYLDPDYRDSHFDLRKPEDLVGKTLIFLGECSENPTLKSSLKTFGRALLGKAIGKTKSVSSLLKERLTELAPENSSCIEFVSEDLFEVLDKEIKDLLVKSNIESELEEMYSRWNTLREKELRDQYEIYIKENRTEEIKRKQNELKEKEETLFFYDNLKKMDIEKEEKLLEWRKKLPKASNIKLKPRKVVSEDYKPPKIK